MSKKKSSPATEDNTSSISAPISSPLPLVLTISEVESLSPSDREKFRHSGGTAIQNPESRILKQKTLTVETQNHV